MVLIDYESFSSSEGPGTNENENSDNYFTDLTFVAVYAIQRHASAQYHG